VLFYKTSDGYARKGEVLHGQVPRVMRQVPVAVHMKFHVSKAGSEWMNELWTTASSTKDITTFLVASYQQTWHTTGVA
jgi:hypothetical protein